MIALYLLVGALGLLVAVFLFGFVGCTPFSGSDSPSPVLPPDPSQPPPVPTPPAKPLDYSMAITSTAGLVAYWRLAEPNPPTFPTMGGYAKDVQGFFNGDYVKFQPTQLAIDKLRHSPATAGNLVMGVSPGLLQNWPVNPCPTFDGAYMQVPWADALNAAQFTFEAWVFPDPTLAPGFFYCLAESTGPPGPNSVGPKKTGWGLYLGPEKPAVAGPPVWQVWMGDGTKFAPVLLAKPEDPDPKKVAPPFAGPPQTLLTLTYLALTFDGTNLQLWIYYPDHNTQIGAQFYLAGQKNVTTFKRNDSSADGKGDFFIGSGSNLFPPPTVAGNPAHRLYPFKGRIQEVALYKTDLSAPSNAGVQKTLVSHELSGGHV
jgi:hypothetical protein